MWILASTLVGLALSAPPTDLSGTWRGHLDLSPGEEGGRFDASWSSRADGGDFAGTLEVAAWSGEASLTYPISVSVGPGGVEAEITCDSRDACLRAVSAELEGDALRLVVFAMNGGEMNRAELTLSR